MALSEHDINLIDRALFDELSGDGLQEFEAKMADPEFREEWKMRQSMHAVIVQKSRAEMKAELQSIENQYPTTPSPRKLFIWLTILGVAIVSTVVYFLFSTAATPKTPEQLFIAYYEPYPNEVDPLTKSSSQQHMSAFQLYESKDYNSAIAEFVPNLTDETARWYFGQSMMATGDYQTAEDVFRQFSRSGDSEFAIHATYYLALIYIKEGRINEAKEFLEKLAVSEHPVYKKRSDELLGQLN